MKNVLYIVSTLKQSGPTNQLFNLIKFFDKNEFEPYLITLSPEPDKSRWQDYRSLNVHLYSVELSRIKGLFFAKKRIQAIIDEIKPDIIHTQGIRSDIISSELMTPIPKVTTIHNIPQLDYIMEFGKLIGNIMIFSHIKAIQKLQYIIGVSNAVTLNLKNNYHISNISSIANGVDTAIYYPVKMAEKDSLRKKLDLPSDVLIWVYSGHLSKLKDPLFLINAWRKSMNEKNDNHLIFLGCGKLQKECEEMTRESKNIHIIGRVNNVADYLQTADYFVSVSHGEGFPLAVLEAMACGLPVLLSDIESHREIINLAPQVGLLYELNNEKGFIEALTEMIYADRNSMSMASLNTIQANLNAKTMSEKYQEIYRSLTYNN